MKRLMALFYLLVAGESFSQEPVGDDRWGMREEMTMSVSGELENWQIRLDQLRKNPMDLNTATAEELTEFGLLDPLQIEGWIRHRSLFGPADTWLVFQSIPGWTEPVILRIKPFCRLGVVRKTIKDRFAGGGQHVLLTRMSWQGDASLPVHVMGGKLNRFFRYRFQSEYALTWGVLMESDAGEPMRGKGPDFVSVFMKGDGAGGKLNWLLGDYSVQLGQGLICWQGMTFGAGSEISCVKRQGVSVRPYQSVGEQRFLRGIALGMQSGKWSGDLFLSRNPQTATIYSLSGEREGFRQVDASGYHRTPAERDKKDRLTEYTIGGRVGRRYKGGRLNWNWIGRHWDIPMFRTDVNNPVDTNWSSSIFNQSIDLSLTRGPMHAFGELAMDGKGSMASVLGAVMVLDPRVDLSLHMRWAGIGYQSVDGQAFQQSSSGRGDRGCYVQVRFRSGERHQFDFFTDLCESPLPGFWASVPSYGILQGFRWQFQPDKKNHFYVRFQSSIRELDVEEGTMSIIRAQTWRSIRIHGQLSLGENQSLAVRTESVRVRSHNRIQEETGFMAYAEWKYQPLRSGIGLDVRLMLVDTDGWASRIYAYERDVLYKVGFPAFSGKMIRSYLNFSCPLGRKTMLWLRFCADKNIGYHYFMNFDSPIRPGLTAQIRYQWSRGSR